MTSGESRPLRILVADDEETIRVLFKALAADLDLVCDAVPDGDEAAEALRRESYPLIFLDLYMPGVPTEQLLVQAGSLQPDATCIIISAEDNEYSMQATFEQGAAAYLTKPLRPAMLREILIKTLYPNGVSA